MTLEEPTGYEKEAEPVGEIEEDETGTDQETLELVAESLGRR